MKTDMDSLKLESHSDDELQAISARCLEIVKERKKQGDIKAFENAIAELEGRGIDASTVRTMLAKLTGQAKAKKKAEPGKVAVFKAGHRYQHPDDSAKVWNGTGPNPAWIKELVAAGKMPIDLGPVKPVAMAS